MLIFYSNVTDKISFKQTYVLRVGIQTLNSTEVLEKLE